jgi:hypothetical protein
MDINLKYRGSNSNIINGGSGNGATGLSRQSHFTESATDHFSKGMKPQEQTSLRSKIDRELWNAKKDRENIIEKELNIS